MSGIDVPAPSEREWQNAVLELIARHFPHIPISEHGDDSRTTLKAFAKGVAALSVPCRLDTGWGSPGVGRQGGPGGCDVAAPAPSSAEKLNTTGADAPSTHGRES